MEISEYVAIVVKIEDCSFVSRVPFLLPLPTSSAPTAQKKLKQMQLRQSAVAYLRSCLRVLLKNI